jgi:hypothetical protein
MEIKMSWQELKDNHAPWTQLGLFGLACKTFNHSIYYNSEQRKKNSKPSGLHLNSHHLMM